MPALNFKEEFIDKITRGQKTQTIRPKRKRPIKVGDRLYLYTGLRTKSTKLLAETVCTDVKTVTIGSHTVVVNGNQLSDTEQQRLANCDGFNTTKEFRKFFESNYSLPFTGYLICWMENTNDNKN